MSITLDPSLRSLTACGCGQGISVRTPVCIDNRPGLSALACRVGTHARFLETLLARLSAASHPGLHTLTTREQGDFTIGLLDAWSAVADVLTFYQERLANEAYLRTATERLSVLELARLIGYQLDPGVAASVALAFEIESARGAFGQALASASAVQAPAPRAPAVTIEAGVKVQSIPGPGETAQTFETIEDLEAHADHNAISPRLTRPQRLRADALFLILDGVALNVAKGDLILSVRDGTAPATYPVQKVSIDNDAQTTRVDFADPPADLPSLDLGTASAATLDSFLEEHRATLEEGPIPLSAALVKTILEQRWKVEDLNALIELQGWDEDEFLRNLREQASQWEPGGKVYVFRQRAKVFGYNAPKQVGYAGTLPSLTVTWTELDPATSDSDPEAATRLHLAEANARVVPGSYVVIRKGGFWTFTPGEVADLVSLGDKLRQPHRVVDRWLAGQLSPATKAALVDFPGQNPDPTPLQKALLHDLNQMVRGPAFYDRQRFEGISVRPEIEALLVQTPQGDELAHLHRLLLEDAYPQELARIQAGTQQPRSAMIRKVDTAQVRPRTAYGISAETTELTLDQAWWDPATEGFEVIRTTTVYAESEKLELAALPVEDEVKAETLEPSTPDAGGVTQKPSLRSVIMLDQAYLGLQTGQTVILSGTRTDLEGVETSEALTIKQAWLEGGFTVLEFEENLVGSYQRSTVRINANVAAATHGETVKETLGSGDGRQPFQRFTLKHTPLTYVTAATTSGRQSTLEVRVNHVLWKEVSSFHGQSPEARIYITQLTDDGKTTVVFGDGLRGARLPTGQENVTAKYRKGIGLGGLVKAGQLSQLMTRPLGVKSAVNPLASAGAEDADTLDQARRNAPITVLTLDRIVSLRDYQDFARNFAGIAKALATWVWFGQTRGVFLTVAGPEGAEISEKSVTYDHLVAAITKNGDPHVPFTVCSYQPRLFRIQGLVKLKSDYLVEKVEPRIEEALREHFSFAEREFGQAVALSEIVAVIHGVEGVSWIDLDALGYSDAWDAGEADSDQLDTDERAVCPCFLAAKVPSADAKTLQPAELLTLDPRPLELEVSL